MPSWIAIDCDMDSHRKIAALPCDEARWAFVVLLMKAKRQRPPGRFADLDHIRYILGPDLSPFVDDFVRVRLLDVAKSGRASIHDWSDYQRDKTDATAAERQKRHRDRLRSNAVSNGVTPVTDNAPRARGRAVAVAVDVDVSPAVEDGNLRARDDAASLIRLVEELTDRPLSGHRIIEAMGADLRALGFERVAAEYRAVVAESSTPLDPAGVIYGAHKRLYPIPEGRRQQRKGKGFNPTSDEAWAAFGGRD